MRRSLVTILCSITCLAHCKTNSDGTILQSESASPQARLAHAIEASNRFGEPGEKNQGPWGSIEEITLTLAKQCRAVIGKMPAIDAWGEKSLVEERDDIRFHVHIAIGDEKTTIKNLVPASASQGRTSWRLDVPPEPGAVITLVPARHCFDESGVITGQVSGRVTL